LQEAERQLSSVQELGGLAWRLVARLDGSLRQFLVMLGGLPVRGKQPALVIGCDAKGEIRVLTHPFTVRI